MGGRSGKAVERCRPATRQGVAGLRFLRRRRQSVFSYLCHGGHMANKSSGGAASAPPRRLNWNDPDVRSVVYQVVALGLVVLVGWFLVSNTLHNMEVRNIASRPEDLLGGKGCVSRVR